MTGRTIYHVILADRHYYFGSVAAIYDTFTSQDLGVSKTRLWSYGIKADKPYRNKVCTIYRGELQRKKKG